MSHVKTVKMIFASGVHVKEIPLWLMEIIYIDLNANFSLDLMIQNKSLIKIVKNVRSSVEVKNVKGLEIW